jgi:hypothetical protein
VNKRWLHLIAGVGVLGAMAAHAESAVTESTTVGGRIYADMTNLDAYANGAKTAASGFGVDVTRFYLILNHTFDSNWSANLTTDFNYSSTTSETQLYVKKAYIQYKVSSGFWAKLGSADLPWVPFEEGVYGYRYFEKVQIDRTSFGTSADWGLHVGGDLLEGGKLQYALSAIEGNGYKNPTRSKSMDFEGRVSFLILNGFTAAIGGYSGKRGKDVEVPAGSPPPTFHTANRIDALLDYKAERFHIGASYYTADNWNNVTTAATDKSDGYSAYGSVNFSPWAIFARYDYAKPSKDLASSREDEYYNLGVSVKPRKGIDVALAYRHDDIKTSGTTNSKFDEVGVWAAANF